MAIENVCVWCGRPVQGLKPGVGGAMVHSGHVDPRLDKTCGTWAFRRVTGPRDKGSRAQHRRHMQMGNLSRSE